MGGPSSRQSQYLGGSFSRQVLPHPLTATALTSRHRNIVVQVISFILAGLLLYLALRGVDFSEMGHILRGANYWWLVPLAFITLFSHVLRAWRWKILLEALPSERPDDAPHRVSIKTAFCSLMIGYMVNYAVPRAGEVVRATSLAAQEKLRFSRVLGTVVVERILDVAMLALALVSVLALLSDRLDVIRSHLFDPALSMLRGISPIYYALVTLALVLGSAWLYMRFFRKQPDGSRGTVSTRLASALGAFREGLLTLTRSPRRVALASSTLAIWFCYLLMAHIPFILFGMDTAYDLSLIDSWSVMNLGALGVALPFPGGTGSYHFITIDTLDFLFSVPRDPAASYAILTHAGQLVLYVAVGFACMLLQGTGIEALRPSQVRKPPSPDHPHA